MIQLDYQTVFIAQLVALVLAGLFLRYRYGLIVAVAAALLPDLIKGWLWYSHPIDLAIMVLRPVVVLTIVFLTKRLVLFAMSGWRQAFASALIATVAIAAGALLIAAYEPMVAPPFLRTAAYDIRELFARQCSAKDVPEVSAPTLPDFAPPAGNVEVLAQVPAAYSNVPAIESGWEHLIGPWQTIRVPDVTTYASSDKPSWLLAVTLTAIIGEDGTVLAAIPTAGPSQLFADAVRIARVWRFEPFMRDGKPAVVQLPDMRIPIREMEGRPAARTPFPQLANLDDVSIRIKRIASFWGGPAFEVTMRGDGTVTYDGSAGVALTGRHCATISRASVARLIDEFRRAEFFSFDDRYVAQVTDLPAQELSITIDGQTKLAFDYGSNFIGDAPDALTGLSHYVLYVTDAERWTNGNARTVPSLQAERWDFASWDNANQWMVAGVARYGDAAALRDLIKAGAPVSTLDHLVLQSPLEIAAMRGERDMLRALLPANHRWTRDQLTKTLLSAARLGDAPIVEALLTRGANVNAREPEQLRSRTPLMIAADAGVPDVVELLLRFKADIKAVDQAGRPALHWAANWHDDHAPPVQGMDRVKVLDLLVKAGSDVNARDNEQRTALFDWWLTDEAVAAALIAHGINVNAQDIDGATALMGCKNPKVTLMLLKAGADPYIKDREGRTALDHARANSTDMAAVAAVLTQWIAAHSQKPASAR